MARQRLWQAYQERLADWAVRRDVQLPHVPADRIFTARIELPSGRDQRYADPPARQRFWDQLLPDPPHAWTRDLVALAAAVGLLVWGHTPGSAIAVGSFVTAGGQPATRWARWQGHSAPTIIATPVTSESTPTPLNSRLWPGAPAGFSPAERSACRGRESVSRMAAGDGPPKDAWTARSM